MTPISIVAFPQDPNPYQESLYEKIRSRGGRVRYAGRLTPSHTLDVLVLPLELALLRAAGYRVFHLHWTFGFRTAGGPRLSRIWFELVMRIAHRLGFTLVWTAHNVLPHDPVFDDDVAARRLIAARFDLVIVHSQATLDELSDIGASPRHGVVIPQGPPRLEGIDTIGPPPAASPRRVAFVGRVVGYKGVEELLAAAADVDDDLEVIVAGACEDRALRSRLQDAGRVVGERVSLRLHFHTDDELVDVLGAADAVVLPFRRVTTSSSLMLALAAGRPAIIPDLPAFADIPDDAVYRYPPGIAGLRDALRGVATAPARELVDKGGAGRALAGRDSWTEIAGETVTAMNRCRRRSAGGRPT